MTETTIEGGRRRPGSPTTTMDLSPAHDDPLGFAADNGLDVTRAEWTRERGHWQIEYRNKLWSDSEIAAATAAAAAEAEEE